MSLLEWLAIAVTILTVYALIKRLETRLVLFTAGFVLCLVSMDPLSALNSFAKSMTNNSLVMAICSSMGFAFIANYTQCDRSLVHYLAAPIRGLGVFLIPICTAVTFFINIAIPSAAGCAAAVGSTLIPVMLRAGIKPAAAAAAVMGGTIGSYLSPGTSHNPFVAEMAGIDVMDFIAFHAMWSILCGVILVVGLLVVCMFLGDHKGEKVDVEAQKTTTSSLIPLRLSCRSFRSRSSLSVTFGCLRSRWVWPKPWSWVLLSPYWLVLPLTARTRKNSPSNSSMVWVRVTLT